MESVELQIRKAGILPLRLHWTDDGDGTDDGTDDEDGTDWEALGDLVQRHARRWAGIELQDYYGEEAILQALCTSQFPQLKYLRVYLLGGSVTISKNWRLSIAQCQNLEDVHLPVMPYLPATPSSNSPIHLQTLHLDLRSMDSHSSHDLESLLRLTPQLAELKVENLLNDTNPPAPFDALIINLPKLRRLEFTNAVTGEERDWVPLLAQIRAPRLEILGLYYQFASGRRSTIGGRTISTVVVTWPSASTNRPEDAPMHSFLRNTGPSAAWRVTRSALGLLVTARGKGSGRLDITLDDRHSLHKQLLEDILTHLAPLGLPVNLDLFHLGR